MANATIYCNLKVDASEFRKQIEYLKKEMADLERRKKKLLTVGNRKQRRATKAKQKNG